MCADGCVGSDERARLRGKYNIINDTGCGDCCTYCCCSCCAAAQDYQEIVIRKELERNGVVAVSAPPVVYMQ